MAKVPTFPISVDPSMWNELTLLAATIFLESEGEPVLGQLGVGWVIRNRADKWGLSIHQGILGPEAKAYDDGKPFEPFSCWNDDYRTKALGRLARIGPHADWAWKDAAAALWKLLPDPTNGATFYLNPVLTKKIRPDGKLPSWYDSEKVTLVSGRHEFLSLG